MDEPDDPLERAAWVLAKAIGHGPTKWREFLPMVRLVFEAMDTPSTAMIDAGNQAMREAWAARGLMAPAVAGDAAVSAAWEAMIDRLLGYRLPDAIENRFQFAEATQFKREDYPDILFDEAKLALYKENLSLIGTAFLMNEGGDMFTTRHVVERCGSHPIFVQMADGARSCATVIAVSDEYDLAALHTDIVRDRFASVRVNEERFTLVPTSGEQIYVAAFGELDRAGFDVELRSGQTIGFVGPQDATSPLNAMRLDFGRCAWGSPVLDYAGILIGIVSAREGDVAHSGDVEFGRDTVLVLNGNAIVDFANKHRLAINCWHKGVNQDSTFVEEHLRSITAMVCRSK